MEWNHSEYNNLKSIELIILLVNHGDLLSSSFHVENI